MVNIETRRILGLKPRNDQIKKNTTTWHLPWTTFPKRSSSTKYFPSSSQHASTINKNTPEMTSFILSSPSSIPAITSDSAFPTVWPVSCSSERNSREKPPSHDEETSLHRTHAANHWINCHINFPAQNKSVTCPPYSWSICFQAFRN